MINSVLKGQKKYNPNIQVLCIEAVENLFIESEIKNFKEKNYIFEVVKGKFYGLDNYSMNFTL